MESNKVFFSLLNDPMEPSKKGENLRFCRCFSPKIPGVLGGIKLDTNLWVIFFSGVPEMKNA